MKRFDRLLDWLFIGTAPFIVLTILFTDNIAFLRFCAAMFIVLTLMSATRDRYRAHVDRRIASINPQDRTAR